MHSTIPQVTTSRRERYRWRVVDIVIASVLGVASALVFFLWDQLYPAVTGPVAAVLPGAESVFSGMWLFAAVLGGLVVRKPGAALFTELVAALVEALLGTQWGFGALQSGLVQGIGAEIVFALFLYANWRLYVAMLAGAGSAVGLIANDLIMSYPTTTLTFKLIYATGALISGVVIAGVGSWVVVRGLAKTGALNRFAAGRNDRALV